MVRGARALVTAVNLRLRVHVEEALQENSIIVESDRLGRGIVELGSWKASSGFEPVAAVAARLSSMDYSIPPHKVRIESMIPSGAGLGSSASLGVAYALALSSLLGDELRGDRLVEAGMAADEAAHGRPSGVDVVIAVYGGFLAYKRGAKPAPVSSRLQGYSLIVADSGVPRRTGDVVEFVLRRAETLGAAAERIYQAADEAVGMAVKAVERGDAALLGVIMDFMHGLLAAMGASGPELDRLVWAARRGGAVGAKLTGAGWGGSVIALAESGEAAGRVVDALRSAGAKWAVKARPGAEGARLEE